ncbi:MAG: hypothetical protein OHK0053_10730 [Microscillaceae bacterium]
MRALRTIRTKLLFSFLILLVITGAIIIINQRSEFQERHIRTLLASLNHIELNNLLAKKLERDFFADETINPLYYQNRSSEYLLARQKSINIIQGELRFLGNARELQDPVLQTQLKKITQRFTEYERVFQEMVELIKKRGFKDYGQEGHMRRYVHEIETMAGKFNLNLGMVLMIRRHEKDFILRKESQYTTKLLAAIQTLKNEIDQKIANPSVRERLYDLLEGYKNAFRELALSEEKIGFTNKSGLRQKLSFISDEISQSIYELGRIILLKTDEISFQNRMAAFSGIGIGLGLFAFIAFYLTIILSRPIRRLSASMMEVIQSDFAEEVSPLPIQSRDEIGDLSRDFAFMLAKMQENIRQIKTQSLKIEQKQQLLQDSLNYASKIQHAILPDEDEIRLYLPDCFVIYRPLHTVSGDFYWFVKRKDYLFVAVVDCTGHGVPGAFMSMIGNTILNEIIMGKKIHEPSFILEILDIEVRRALKQAQKGNDDGMEICLCRIEKKNGREKPFEVLFSGAKGNLFYADSGEILFVKGTRRAIGGRIKNDKQENFAEHILHLHAGAHLYLSSDGYFDQPDANRKRFGKKRFKQTLANCLDLPMSEQKTALETALDHFGTQQRDDITLWGIML